MDMEVLGYHLNFSARGFWLPNDERGSNSREVRALHLRPFGPAPESRPRRSVARKQHDYKKRLEAKKTLIYPPVEFSGQQALSIAHGFADYVARSGLIVLACAILPRHVHLVILRQRIIAEHVVGQLKAAATHQLLLEGLHPYQHLSGRVKRLPSPWAAGCTKIFLYNEESIRFEMDYVLKNPEKEGKRRQQWSFVQPFVGLP